MKTSLACLLVALTSGCPNIKADPGEGPGQLGGGPTVEFDPANSIIPFPNNLVMCGPSGKDATGAPCTIGKVAIPAPACESAASLMVRTQVLNKLDGFGTYEVGLQLTLTAPADMATVAANVVLYKRAAGATPVTSTTPVPAQVVVAQTLRFDPAACTTPKTIDAINLVPLVPLDEKSTYTVAVLSGLKTADGKDYLPSSTWALVRQKTDPVTVDASGNVISEQTPLDPTVPAQLAQLLGLDQLWKAHAQALAFLDTAGHSDRSTVLLAWDFTTQTTTDPLDPTVTGSPASTLSNAGLFNPVNMLPGVISVAKLKGAPCMVPSPNSGCTGFFTAINLPCGPGALPCDKVGDVIGAGLLEANYQTPQPNSLDATKPIPGPWTDPVTPTVQSHGALEVLAFVPNPSNVTMPANGWPVVVFGHGLGSSKEALFAIAAQLASAGFASVAIDAVAHGSRAVRTSNDAALGCSGACSTTTTTACTAAAGCPTGETCNNGLGIPISATTTQQCFAPILSADLATTRDNIRQTVLDFQRLTHAVTACGAAACPSINGGLPFAVDPAHIVYMGQSMGGIIGSIITSVTTDLKAGVLDVPGVGWLDVLENTQTKEISCLLVDALIDAGILMGAKFDPSTGTGLCTTNAWQQQPGYQQFRAVARWIIDPADPANFTPKLATRRFLIQEVVGDQVVPNIATDREGALVGLTPATADRYLPPNNLAPSAAITMAPTTSKWLRYPTLPAAGTFPGNKFEHASLLRPAADHCSATTAMACDVDAQCPTSETCVAGAPGFLATGRLQTDAITFLFENN